jgi:hypothetical protein
MNKLQFIFNSIHNDAAEPWQLGFQDSASPAFSGLVELHNKIGFFFNSNQFICILSAICIKLLL